MNILSQIGLNEKQEKVYMTLAEYGEMNMTELAKKVGIKRPSVYLIVDELIMLGLLSDTKKNKDRVISAVHPRRLVQIAESRANAIKDKLPAITAIYNSAKTRPKIFVYEGKEGVHGMTHDLLSSINSKDEMLFITHFDSITQDEIRVFKQAMAKERKARVRELDYGNEAGKKWMEEIYAYEFLSENYEGRLLPEELELGVTDIIIYKDRVYISSRNKDTYMIVIESKEITKTYRTLFEAAWLLGVPYKEKLVPSDISKKQHKKKSSK